MHFLFTAPVFHTNQHYAVKALLDAGHEVSFLALIREHSAVYDVLQPTILGESATLCAVGVRAPTLTNFYRLMRRLAPDVVIVRNPNTVYGLLSTIVSRLMGRTVIFYTQTPMYRRLAWHKKLVRSFPARVARAKWITPVLGFPKQCSPAFGALRYVPFVMEPQTTSKQKRWFRGGAINVLSVGKFEVRKNHRLFLQAIADLSARYPVRATVIGEAATPHRQREYAEIKELRKSLGLEDRVCLKTNVPYWDVQREYAKHDLFVLPSRDEPAAVSHLEAMAHSLPVICSDSNGTQCYIRPGVNGYVFRSDDLGHLEECIEHVIRDRQSLLEMGKRSNELIASEHSPEKYVAKLVSLVEGDS